MSSQAPSYCARPKAAGGKGAEGEIGLLAGGVWWIRKAATLSPLAREAIGDSQHTLDLLDEYGRASDMRCIRATGAERPPSKS